MLKLLTAGVVSEYASCAAVILVSTLVGAYAAQGMTSTQWLGGLAAVGGAIAWAVIVRAWPATPKA
jgi:general stress protein CsbA